MGNGDKSADDRAKGPIFQRVQLFYKFFLSERPDRQASAGFFHAGPFEATALIFIVRGGGGDVDGIELASWRYVDARA